MVSIVDYGAGNLFSVIKAFERLGIAARIVRRADELRSSERIVLPGVGYFGTAIEKLRSLGLDGALDERARDGRTPILGICLGMQLMSARSEEGGVSGFGWFDAQTVRFAASGRKIPHMGWNTVVRPRPHPLFEGIAETAEFYFVHSYHVILRDSTEAIGITEYGQEFVSAMARGPICAVQFHPEKSHQAGLRLLKNFAGMEF